MLERAAELAARNRSDSLLVIRNGALVLERYWNDKTANDFQQTYSATKSLYALLVGRSIARGYLRDIDQPVRKLVPEMPAMQSEITFRSVLAMQSGKRVGDAVGDGEFHADRIPWPDRDDPTIALERAVIARPFEKYHYNNAAYRLTFTALERASGMDLEDLTVAEIFDPLSFSGAHWMRIHAVSEEGERLTGYQSVRMTPRDFAKPAQVILDRGMWNGERFLSASYVDMLVRAPTPEVNPSFGLFHHLNAGSFCRNFAVPDIIGRQLLPGAPEDSFLMFGAGGQVVIGIPSLRLVIVRTGGGSGSIYDADYYVADLIRLIRAAVN